MSSSTSSKRHSVLPSSKEQHQPPKPSVQFSSSISIHDTASLVGTHPIQISSESIVHPRARIESFHGRVQIGRRCILSERSVIGGSPSSSPNPITTTTTTTTSSSSSSSSSSSTPPEVKEKEKTAAAAVTIGDYVTLEPGAVIEAGNTVVSEGTTLGVGSRVGAGAVIGRHCTLTAHSSVKPGEKLPDFTVVFSGGMRRADRRGVAELRNKGQARQIEVLRRLVVSNPAKFQS